MVITGPRVLSVFSGACANNLVDAVDRLLCAKGLHGVFLPEVLANC